MGMPRVEYTGPGARNTDPETSHIAARRNIKKDTNCWKILMIHYLRQEGGLSDYELDILFDPPARRKPDVKDDGEAHKRRADLKNYKLVAWTGELRPSSKNRSMRVWRITQAGIDLVREMEWHLTYKLN